MAMPRARVKRKGEGHRQANDKREGQPRRRRVMTRDKDKGEGQWTEGKVKVIRQGERQGTR